MPSSLRSWALFLLFAAGCASAPPPEPDVAHSAAVNEAIAAENTTPTADAPKRAVPEGHIRREDVMAMLSEGVPSLLQKVEVEARLDREGRFLGWRVVAIRDPLLATSDLQTGDVIRRVNGQVIENPYQFFDVFQSLAFAPELHLMIERGAEPKDLRYPISDDPSAPPIPKATMQAPPPEAPATSPGAPPPAEDKAPPKKKKKGKKKP